LTWTNCQFGRGGYIELSGMVFVPVSAAPAMALPATNTANAIDVLMADDVNLMVSSHSFNTVCKTGLGKGPFLHDRNLMVPNDAAEAMTYPFISDIDVVDGARSRQRAPDRLIVVNKSHQGAVAMQITTIGLDIAKNVFQVHGVDAAEKVVVYGAAVADHPGARQALPQDSARWTQAPLLQDQFCTRRLLSQGSLGK
jgi:hypothetical protein